MVALTFDAGANANGVPSILATLRREGVPATFYLTGNFVRDFPAAARSIAAAGFRIGDHTVSHPHLTQLSDAAVRQEILGGAAQIAAVTGKNPAPLFRFPFGDASAHVIAIANQTGYVPVRWTVDSLGWEGTAGHSPPRWWPPGCWPRPSQARSSSCTSGPIPTITPRSTPTHCRR